MFVVAEVSFEDFWGLKGPMGLLGAVNGGSGAFGGAYGVLGASGGLQRGFRGTGSLKLYEELCGGGWAPLGGFWVRN